MLEKILVLGASGLIGSYLYKELKEKNYETVGTYSSKERPGLIHFDLAKDNPNSLPLDNTKYLVICSAVTKIDNCHNNQEHSHAVNIEGISRVLSEAYSRDIVPVFLSSASVFDGVTGNYKEEDRRNPTTTYGKQKETIEDLMFSNSSLIIRPGKVFGVNASEGVLFTDWLEKYQNSQEIKCADDERLSPHYVEDVARGISALLMLNAKGVYHTNPPFFKSRYEMASDFFSHLGITDANLVRCSIDDFSFSEKRPRNTYLNADKFIRKTGFTFTPLEECFSLIRDNRELFMRV